MAFSDIVFRRLEILILRLKDSPIPIAPNSPFGKVPIGWGDTFLKGQFRGHVNGPPAGPDDFGFKDLLGTKRIEASEIDGSTTVGELADAIVAKSKIEDAEAYEAAMGTEVLGWLRTRIAQLAQPPLDRNNVLPDRRVDSFLPDPGDVTRLLEGLNQVFQKYLIGGPVQRADLNATVAEARDEIVLHMLA